MMTFRDFTIEDFLQHPVFRQWVLEQDAAAAGFWEQWLQDNPDKKNEIAKAKELLLLMGGPSHAPAPQDEQETWERVLHSINNHNHDKSASGKLVKLMRGSPRNKKSRLHRWIPYAAILIGVMVVTYAAFFFYRGDTVRYATVMGEMRTIELPDHSVVRLNVNSTLRYSRNWGHEKPREVWLGGEAFFTVQHQSNNRPFIVHTNDVDIQVVGTEFNVNTRQVKTQVVLSNGIVKLLLNTAKSQAGAHKPAPITMKPGDMVTYSSATAELTNKKVNPAEYASWRNRVLVFNETPIRDVISSLQDNLGITIQLEDESLGSQTFTGSIPIDNVAVFFKTLTRSFNIHIEKTGDNTYVISKISG